jgi:hypothetical protein
MLFLLLSSRGGSQLGAVPKWNWPRGFQEFIVSDRRCFRRILALSPVGNCPYLNHKPSAPTRSRNLETWGVQTWGILQSQVK